MRRRISSRCLGVFIALLGLLATIASAQDGPPSARMLNAGEGLILVNTASKQQGEAVRKTDCSHLVHRIYELAGFPYPYASSYDLYDGIDNFRRVSAPRPGDLVVWRGHVGILTDAVRHIFYSSVSSGFRTEYYDGPYWRSQGRPRFYRYLLQIQGPAEFTATNASGPRRNSTSPVRPVHQEILDAPPLETNASTIADSPAPSPNTKSPLNHPSALPSSVVVMAVGNIPTEEEVGEAISEFNSAAGNLLRDWPTENSKRAVLVYDKLRVVRIELKHDRGWVNAVVEERLSIGDKGFEGKRRVEKLRWELRRTPQGWQLQMPADRAFVPRDVAVQALAGQLAFLTQHEPDSDDRNRSLHDQSLIVHALGFLFEAD